MTPDGYCCAFHARRARAQGVIGGNRWPESDDIDWRGRRLAALFVVLFWVGVILLIGIAGGMDVAGA